MKYDIYFVDAFADDLFYGNPAAVIFSDLDDKQLMQNIAAENNLSETAFIKTEDDKKTIRWFSPTTEVDLCGHATLASAFVFFNFINPQCTEIKFHSASGELTVKKKLDIYELDFPKDNLQLVNTREAIEQATGFMPNETFLGNINMFAVFENEEIVRKIKPNFEKLKDLDGQGLIISSTSVEYDFVSRYFCPKYGINEDPVTGSAHTSLIPYWAEKLNKEKLKARQVSKRGGVLFCQNAQNRVFIGGKAILYMKGKIEID
tara:strand:+ start:3039 stop:3821 length:783 start_codon:yes stop_codon:yes gene_type:complete